jgi:glycosyltransferase involved in cell wall biosynthesis
LRSIFASLSDCDDHEIIYVDSASEDATVEIAQRFPIRILQLRRTWKLTPSAGRFVGYQHSSGKYLLFVDGDTVLHKRWLRESIAFLKDNPEFGGVAGIMHQAYQSREGECVEVKKNHYGQSVNQAVQIAPSLEGIALYRREAMEKAGTFNPYLSTGEECEVALRIQRAGYKLARIYTPMCITYSAPRESVQEIMRRSRSHLYDYGTTLRYCLANGCGFKFSITQMSFIFTFIGAALALMSLLLIAIVIRSAWLLAGAVAIALLYVALKRRHPRNLGISLLKRSMMTYHTVLSFINTRIMPAESYPTDVIVVK